MKKNESFFIVFGLVTSLSLASCSTQEKELLSLTEAKSAWDEVERFNFDSSSELSLDDISSNAPKTRAEDRTEFLTGGTMVYPTQNILADKYILSGTWHEVYPKKNPYYLIFNFSPEPYVVEVKIPKGKVSYALAFREAMKSNEWAASSKSNTKFSAEASFKEVKSYSDISTAFGGNISVASSFSGQASYSVNSKKYKSILLARLKVGNFKVETEVNGKITNDQVEDKSQAYVSSMTYGKVAYLIIYSNYNFDQVKSSIQLAISSKMVKGEANYSKELTKILSESESYVWIKGDNSDESFWGTTPTFINKMFTAVFDRTNVGVPVFFELKYVNTNVLIDVKDFGRSKIKSTRSERRTR